MSPDPRDTIDADEQAVELTARQSPEVILRAAGMVCDSIASRAIDSNKWHDGAQYIRASHASTMLALIVITLPEDITERVK
jgi:hypothetical protein